MMWGIAITRSRNWDAPHHIICPARWRRARRRHRSCTSWQLPPCTVLADHTHCISRSRRGGFVPVCRWGRSMITLACAHPKHTERPHRQGAGCAGAVCMHLPIMVWCKRRPWRRRAVRWWDVGIRSLFETGRRPGAQEEPYSSNISNTAAQEAVPCTVAHGCTRLRRQHWRSGGGGTRSGDAGALGGG